MNSVATADFLGGRKQLVKGDIVLIDGLQNKTELNDKFATVFSYGHGKDHDRYRVLVADCKEQKGVLIKRSNLHIVWLNALTQLQRIEHCLMLQHKQRIGHLFDSILSYYCKACGGPIHSESKIMISCSKCMSVYFCSIHCRDSHAEDHKLDCPAYVITLKESNKWALRRLGSLQFDIMSSILSVPSSNAFEDWIHVQYGVLNYCLMKFEMQQNPTIIKSWEEWYEFHRTPLSHPIAKHFHNVMTIYWALIQNGLKPDYKGEITVHLIGVANSELKQGLHDFDELQLLLPYCNITFICFGPETPNKTDSKVVRRSNTFYFYKELYQRETVAKVVKAQYQTADIVIGLNTGFGTVDGPHSPISGWPKALLYVLECKVPAFFTDFTMTCVLIQDCRTATECGGRLNDVQPNPFFQPCMVFATPGRVLSFHNNWIFTINPKGQRISKFRLNPLQYRLSKESKQYRRMMEAMCELEMRLGT